MSSIENPQHVIWNSGMLFASHIAVAGTCKYHTYSSQDGAQLGHTGHPNRGWKLQGGKREGFLDLFQLPVDFQQVAQSVFSSNYKY